MKEIKAWAFLASKNDGEKYFVPFDNGEETIYFKKPKPIMNPFDYGQNLPTWKPTEISITIKPKK